MSKRVEIDLVIDADGTVRCDVHDKGPACLEVQEIVKAVLGPVEVSTPKPELYEQPASIRASAEARTKRG